MKCPKCGAKSIVYKTQDCKSVVLRYRKCMKCRHKFKTQESE